MDYNTKPKDKLACSLTHKHIDPCRKGGVELPWQNDPYPSIRDTLGVGGLKPIIINYKYHRLRNISQHTAWGGSCKPYTHCDVRGKSSLEPIYMPMI
jgi:hypothetical protein